MKLHPKRKAHRIVGRALNLNRPSLFPAASSAGHLLSRSVPSLRGVVGSKHQKAPSSRAASAAVIVRLAPFKQRGGVRFYLHLPSPPPPPPPPPHSVGVRENSALITVSAKVRWGGQRKRTGRNKERKQFWQGETRSFSKKKLVPNVTPTLTLQHDDSSHLRRANYQLPFRGFK